ncbi:hypothetical protein ACIQCG_13550 [Streptomyces noursei]|uniref:hypothetical protein n=1 Tax=Streptomyces noursei TaxID=1971 RepID=UPI00382C6DE2
MRRARQPAARRTLAEQPTKAVEHLELASTICHYTAIGITKDPSSLHDHWAASAR